MQLDTGSGKAMAATPFTDAMLSEMALFRRPPGRDYVLAASKGAVAYLMRDADSPSPVAFDGTAPQRRLTDFSLFGMQIKIADVPREKVFDWSDCRSPSRARRRHAQGHPQRVKITEREVMYLMDRRAMEFRDGWERRVAKMALDAALGTSSGGAR